MAVTLGRPGSPDYELDTLLTEHLRLFSLVILCRMFLCMDRTGIEAQEDAVLKMRRHHLTEELTCLEQTLARRRDELAEVENAFHVTKMRLSMAKTQVSYKFFDSESCNRI